MAHEGSSSTRYGPLLVPVIVSLVGGVGAGYLLHNLTERLPALSYTVVSSERFSGQQAKVGILAVRVANPGRTDAEDVNCRIDLPGGKITEYRVTGLAPSAWTAQNLGNHLDVAVPYLNPSETFTVSILTALDSSTGEPSVMLRGKGVTGQPVDAQDSPFKRRAEVVSDVLAAMLTVVVAVMLMPGVRNWRLRAVGEPLGDRHTGDQRDVVAYVLGLHDLRSSGQRIRNSPRELSYWALADELTEEWLGKGDVDQIRRGMEALTFLIAYAAMNADSARLIQVNIARLAVRIGDIPAATKALAIATGRREKLILKRVASDPDLQKLHESTTRA